MVFLTADLHFFHRGVINLCDRPFSSIEEMNDALIQNWNRVVTKDKYRVYVVGDVSFGSIEATKKIMSQLNGYKILVKGNHDRSTKVMMEIGFDEVMENEFIKLGPHRVLISHYPFHPVEDYKKDNENVSGQGISFVNDKKYLHKRILDDGQTWLIHGHVHNAWKQKGKQINVGTDVWGYTPVSQEKIIKLIDAGPQDLDVKNHGEYDDQN
jgi:calcineurin-like phosphoesterase family protein